MAFDTPFFATPIRVALTSIIVRHFLFLNQTIIIGEHVLTPYFAFLIYLNIFCMDVKKPTFH